MAQYRKKRDDMHRVSFSDIFKSERTLKREAALRVRLSVTEVGDRDHSAEYVRVLVESEDRKAEDRERRRFNLESSAPSTAVTSTSVTNREVTVDGGGN
jgi:hypothetical protein